jgi:hypothetical protein
MVNSNMIKNINMPSCRNCIHYKPKFFYDYSSSFNKCNYFGIKDIETGIITYDYTSSFRSDENKCGINGTYFEQDKNIKFKIFLHNFIRYSPFSIYLIIIFYVNFKR